MTLQRLDLDVTLTAVTLGPRAQLLSEEAALLLRLRPSAFTVEADPGREAELAAYYQRVVDDDIGALRVDRLANVTAAELPRAVMLTNRGEQGIELARLGAWRDVPMGELAYAFVPGNAIGGAAFADYTVFAPVIPVESSPLSGESIGALVTGIGGQAILVASGHDPLLLVKAGVGVGGFIVIVGTARSVTAGINHWIERWFGVNDDESDDES